MVDDAGEKTNRRIVRKLWIGIGILVLLSPLGIIIPAYLGAGSAWGEWGLREITRMTGFAPEGMKRIADTWRAPLTNYTIPGQGTGLVRGCLGYIAAAVAGITATAGLAFLFAKLLARRNGHSEHK